MASFHQQVQVHSGMTKPSHGALGSLCLKPAVLAGRGREDQAASMHCTELEESVSAEHMAAPCHEQDHRYFSQRLVWAEGVSPAALQHPGISANVCKYSA